MNSKWMRSASVVWEVLDGEGILVDASTGLRWALNASAVRIWSQCDGQRSRYEIARAFAAGAGHVVRDARRQAAEFCESLAKSGLLVSSGGNAAASFGNCRVDRFASGAAPIARPLGLGANSRRRPSPRGNSGPG